MILSLLKHTQKIKTARDESSDRIAKGQLHILQHLTLRIPVRTL
jgi:hypothetical protein